MAYNGEKMNKDEGRVLGANKIILPADGQIDIARMVENFNAFMPKTGKIKKPVLHIPLIRTPTTGFQNSSMKSSPASIWTNSDSVSSPS